MNRESFSRLYSLSILPFLNTAGFWLVPRTAVLGGRTVPSITGIGREDCNDKEEANLTPPTAR